jgi:TnpA family transposase
LGFALQLLTLRYLGFIPDDLSSVPDSIVEFISHQLDIPTQVLSKYGRRMQTRTQHQQCIEQYLGFRSASQSDLEKLSAWLVERALEHDKPSLLLQLATAWLRQEKLVRIGITQLERRVVTARQTAYQETFRRLQSILTPERQTFLDSLLQNNPKYSGTPLTWLRRHATTNSPTAILNAIAKLDLLQQQAEVLTWNVSSLTPNRLKLLAQIAKRASNQTLQRMPEARRYPILVAFVVHLYEEVTDEVMDLFIQCLADAYARSRQDLETFRSEMANAVNEKVRMLKTIGSILIDAEVSDPQVRTTIYEQISMDKLEAVVHDCDHLIRPEQDHYFDYFAKRYGFFRRFIPAFLRTFEFRSNRSQDPLLKALEVLRRLDQEHRRKVPQTAPVDFVSPKWKQYVIPANGEINRCYYELCTLWELRSALRSGDVWLEHSRRYANPESYLIPQKQWQAMRTEMSQQPPTTAGAETCLAVWQTELTQQLQQFQQTVVQAEQVRLEADGFVLTPLVAMPPDPHLEMLQKQMRQCLPWVELTQLLIEVDQWTQFSAPLVAAGLQKRTPNEARIYLYAVIIAQACNLSMAAMAKASGLSEDQLNWYTHWYLQEEALNAAITTMVNFQYRQPLSQYWGSGTLSSSDGQRFPVAVKHRQAQALPRYFGYGKGITFYTWTADQYSQYRNQVIPTTVRDATYVLDGILDNETELAVVEHTTDTAGYTDVLFALFDLLGLQFSPRIRDLSDQRLYRVESVSIPEELAPLFKAKINAQVIIERWDEMLRLATSIQRGWVTASLFMAKLQSFEQRNSLLRALQEYGRLIKTCFILRYLNQQDYRQRIGAQLNKGERLHDLRRFLFFANQGQLRRPQEEDISAQAHCLTLVTNAVVTWNTVYMAEVLTQIQQQGTDISPEALAHLSPTRHEHINPHGKYLFDLELELKRTALRPLRV